MELPDGWSLKKSRLGQKAFIHAETNTKIFEVPDENTIFELAKARPKKYKAFLERIKTETEKDPALSRLKDCIINGWPQHSALPSTLLPFYNFKDELSVNDNIIFKGDKIVVPVYCRQEMKEALHTSHRAADACIRRARQLLYWPSMASDIKQHSLIDLKLMDKLNALIEP